MAKSIRSKIDEAGHKIAETASKVGHRVGEKVEKATDWVKEKTHMAGNRVDEIGEALKQRTEASDDELEKDVGWEHEIREDMTVVGTCGNFVGSVEHVEAGQILLARDDSPEERRHIIPIEWVAEVDDRVHLNRSCDEARREWAAV
jgi:hypothetical protein